MNVFYVDKHPVRAAEQMCDKHIVKMILESAQLLCTCHRVQDGTEYYDKTANGRKIKRWKHPNPNLEPLLYKAGWENTLVQYGCLSLPIITFGYINT